MFRYFKWLGLVVFIGIVGMVYLNAYITEMATDNLYSDIKKVPAKKAALVLGTAKFFNGRENYFYNYRIQAAVQLFKEGKVKAIVVSGDNGSKVYDEATDMYDDLIKAGVPSQYITRDYAGFRTLDSLVRAEAVFDLDNYIIVSQKFHLERALFIAEAKKQKVIGYIAKDLTYTAAAKKMKLREYLARVKAFLDVYILETDPRFYGKKEKVNYKS